MGRALRYAWGVAAVLGTLAGAGPAFADFGAVAYDQNNCAWGRSWHLESPRRAADVALAECGHRGCRLVLEVGSGQCGALAASENCRGYGWGKDFSRRAAEAVAMENCRRFSGPGTCSIRVTDCNR